MSALIMRLLAKDPDDRPASADAVLDELDAMTITVGPSTPVSGGVAGIIAAPARPLTKVFAGIGVLAVAIIIAAFIMKPGSQIRAQRQARMQAHRDSVKVVTDSLTRIAQAATAAAPVLSRDDSVRIAENVNRAMRQARIRDSVSRAKLRDSIQRAEEKRARDSIFRAYGGTRLGTTAKRRIVILEPAPSPRWPQAEQVGRAVADSLRSMLSKRAFAIVSPDSVRAARAGGLMQSPNAWAEQFGSELLVAIRIEERTPRRGQTGPDSVRLRINAYDITAQPRYYSRSLPTNTEFTVHGEMLSSLEATLLQTVGALEEMSRAPRRAPGDTSRGAMTTITLPDGRTVTVPIGTFPANAFEMLGRGRTPNPAAQSTPPTQPKKPPPV
jgi:hypothetical protein